MQALFVCNISYLIFKYRHWTKYLQTQKRQNSPVMDKGKMGGNMQHHLGICHLFHLKSCVYFSAGFDTILSCLCLNRAFNIVVFSYSSFLCVCRWSIQKPRGHRIWGTTFVLLVDNHTVESHCIHLIHRLGIGNRQLDATLMSANFKKTS